MKVLAVILPGAERVVILMNCMGAGGGESAVN
jgi:hypothetical protein